MMLVVAGTKGATLKSDDSMEEVLHVMDHDSILFFTQVRQCVSSMFKLLQAALSLSQCAGSSSRLKTI